MVTGGEMEGARGKIGEEDEEIDTTLYKIGNKDILHSTGKYSHYFAITLNGV